MHGLRQREDAALADIVREKARHAAVHARVAQPLDGIGRVGNGHGERRAQDGLDVLLRGDEVDHAGLAALGGKQVEECVIGVLAERVRDLRERLALERLIFLRVQRDRNDVLKADKVRDVFKVAARLHALAHGGAGARIAQRGGQRVQPALLKFRRQNVNELGRAGGIGIHVAGDVQPLRAGVFKEPQHLRHGAAPIPPPDALEVRDLHGAAQLPRDGQHLAQRVHHAVALLPHMNGDGQPPTAQRLKRADQPLGRVKALGRVAETQRHAHRAVGE